jgi:sugar (pentulose or hexulose) kinase
MPANASSRAAPILLGIDVGTSVVKSVAFDESGKVVALARRQNAFDIPQPGWAECDMEAVWARAKDAITDVICQLPGGASQIRALGVSGNMGGAWLVSSDGRPVRPAILWNDGRAAKIVNDWRHDHLLNEIFTISGNTPVPGFTVPLLVWLQQHEPDVLEQANRLFFSKDWISYQLTGESITEESDASHIPGDVTARGYSTRILELCGVSELQRLLLPIKNSSSIIGHVHAAAARETGLAEGTPVIAGLADVSATLTGAGAITSGCASVIIGTSCLNSVTTSEPILEPQSVGFSFLIPGGRWTRTLANQTGTLALSWFANVLTAEGARYSSPPLRQLEEEAASAPLGARGIIFHPYLNSTGVSAPVFEPRARARFWGLSLEHSRADLLRSIFEGVALATADCFQHLPPFEGPIRLMGGGARSRFWRQMFADAIGHTLALPRHEELGALGVALLAGVATGVWGDLEEACSACCQIVDHVEPDQQRHAEYQRILAMYQRLRRDLVEEHDYYGELGV